VLKTNHTFLTRSNHFFSIFPYEAEFKMVIYDHLIGYGHHWLKITRWKWKRKVYACVISTSMLQNGSIVFGGGHVSWVRSCRFEVCNVQSEPIYFFFECPKPIIHPLDCKLNWFIECLSLNAKLSLINLYHHHS